MNKRDRLAILLPVIMPIIAFWQVASCHKSLKWDALEQYYPNRYLISQFLAEQVLPFWNPRIQLGFPMASDPQSGVFYPPVWILAKIVGYDLCLFQLEWIGHLIVGGLGMFFLLRQVGIKGWNAAIFAVIYQLSGPFLSNGQHMTYIISMAWLPWSMGFLRAACNKLSSFNTVGLGFSISMGLIGGYPAFTFILIYVFAVVVSWELIVAHRTNRFREFLPKMAGIVAGGVFSGILSSGYLYAVAQAMPHTNRGSGVSLERALEGSLKWESMVTFVAPFANSDLEHLFPMTSMMNVYMGFFTIPLILHGLLVSGTRRKILPWTIGGLIMLMIAMGDIFPLRAWIYHLPLLDYFRFPAIFRVFTILFFLISAALAWNGVNAPGLSGMRKRITGPYALFLVLLGLLFLSSSSYLNKLINSNGGGDFGFPGDFYFRAALYTGFALLLISGVWILSTRNFKIFVLGTSLLMLVDVLVANQLNAPINLYADVPVSQIQSAINKYPSGFQNPDPDKPMLDDNMYSPPEFNPMVYNGTYFTNGISFEGYYPFSLKGLQSFDEHPDKWNRLQNGLFFFKADGTDTASATIQIKKWLPTSIELIVENSVGGKLVYFQNDYPAWEVEVNGKKAKKSLHYETLVGVALEPGEHWIRIVYRDQMLKLLWKTMALLNMGVLLFFLIRSIRRFIVETRVFY